LSEHLGNAKPYIDLFADQGPEGLIVKPDVIHKSFYKGNWKYQAENTHDGYHFEFTHQSIVATRERRGERRFPRGEGGHAPEEGWNMDLGNGHFTAWGTWSGPAPGYLRPGGGQVYRPTFIFPNVALIDVQIRHIVPKAADLTEQWISPVLLKGVPDEHNQGRLRSHEDFYGPMGLGAPDDWENFERVQLGNMSSGDSWIRLMRGLGAEIFDEATDQRAEPGVAVDSEVCLRSIYRQWKKMMMSD
jgi:phenylpropionate dioxygenase-like ring-hydroxylating dioxygenase large terminal subunit